MKKNQILASESFRANSKRSYFLDFRRSEDGSIFISLACSDQQLDGSFKRNSLTLSESYFAPFISAFSSLFQAAAYQHRGYQTVMDIFNESRGPGGIKAMPSALRPREKMYAQGAQSLADAELLAILLGSGTPGESSIELADRILSTGGSNAEGLLKSSFASLCRFKGMGLAKASSVLAALELGRRIYRKIIAQAKDAHILPDGTT